MAAKIPILDLKPEIEAHWAEFSQAMESVVRSGQFICGPQGEALEKEVAAYLGVEHAVGVNSGTDALILSLRAMGVGPGVEVITSPFSFFATAEAITLLGGEPVFVDIDPDTLNLDVNKIEAKISERTKAILPVHLFGLAAEMGPMMKLAEKYSLKVLEDAAQSFGAELNGKKLGAIGDAATFSFFPTKNFGAFGDAGMVTTNDAGLAAEVRRLRTHGSIKRYHHEIIGYCSRLDEMQAAVLRVKLPRLDARNRLRVEAAHRYDSLLENCKRISIPKLIPGAKHIFHQYTIRILDGKRDTVCQRLADQGIGSMIYYPIPIHRSPVYANVPRDLPAADQAASEVLSLPMWPEITLSQQKEVVDRLVEALQ